MALVTIIPTIFSHTKKQFMKRWKKLAPHAPLLQVDIMDGRFVRPTSIKPKDLPLFSKPVEAHLMVKKPTQLLPILKHKRVKRAIAHIEAFSTTAQARQFIDTAKKRSIEPALALNPETPCAAIEPFLRSIKIVLFLGVHPGKEHQLFIPAVLEKIRRFHKKHPKAMIQVDGGVKPETMRVLFRSGVRRVNTGSYTASATNVKDAIARLQKMV